MKGKYVDLSIRKPFDELSKSRFVREYSESHTLFDKIISNNYSALLELHTLTPAIDRLVDDIQLNNNADGMSQAAAEE
jgi:hypothetical protein